MFTLVIGGVICIASSFIGWYIKGIYKARCAYLDALADFVDYVAREISNYKTNFADIITHYIDGKSGTFVDSLAKYKASGYKDMDISSSKLSVLNQEKRYAYEILQNIGKYDSATELDRLQVYQKELATKCASAHQKYSKEGTMAFNLSVLLGIVIMIIVA